jgi:hypothetical protein
MAAAEKSSKLADIDKKLADLANLAK